MQLASARPLGIASLAALLGIFVYWVAASLAENRWLEGSPFFLWLAGTLVLPLVLGLSFPRNAWLLGLYVLLGQAGFLAVTETGDLNQLPIGLAVYLILAVPAVAMGALGGFVRGRLGGPDTTTTQ